MSKPFPPTNYVGMRVSEGKPQHPWIIKHCCVCDEAVYVNSNAYAQDLLIQFLVDSDLIVCVECHFEHARKKGIDPMPRGTIRRL